MSPDEGVLTARWIALSGLPLQLLERGKSPAPWLLLRTIIELDMEQHPLTPGLVELPLADFSARCGLDGPRIEKALKTLRKEALVRAFLPEHDEETALFEVLCPLATPLSADEVAAAHPAVAQDGPWPPRYAGSPAEGGEAGDVRERQLSRINRVVELYLDTFSMKINSLILEELGLIAARYDTALIEKVFQRAKKEERRSLGWIVTEIRREQKFAAKAEELRRSPTTSAL